MPAEIARAHPSDVQIALIKSANTDWAGVPVNGFTFQLGTGSMKTFINDVAEVERQSGNVAKYESKAKPKAKGLTEKLNSRTQAIEKAQNDLLGFTPYLGRLTLEQKMDLVDGCMRLTANSTPILMLRHLPASKDEEKEITASGENYNKSAVETMRQILALLNAQFNGRYCFEWLHPAADAKFADNLDWVKPTGLGQFFAIFENDIYSAARAQSAMRTIGRRGAQSGEDVAEFIARVRGHTHAMCRIENDLDALLRANYVEQFNEGQKTRFAVDFRLLKGTIGTKPQLSISVDLQPPKEERPRKTRQYIYFLSLDFDDAKLTHDQVMKDILDRITPPRDAEEALAGPK